MLTQEEKNIVKETVPLLQEKGVDITSNFYNRLFTSHPELRNMFNQTNQKKGLQSKALAMSVLAAAQNIDDLTPIVPVVMPIAYKHCALQVQPADYDIVGENLIKAIQDVTGLGDDDPIITAWTHAYGEIAQAFIGIEQDIYSKMAWTGFQPTVVKEIVQQSNDIKSFTVEADFITADSYTPGQYITVDVESDKLPYRAKRHYSIVDGGEGFLTFGVKRDVTTEHEGEVSTVLHDEVSEGDTLYLSAPTGGFSVAAVERPQLFIGSGVGVTPLVSMYRETVNHHTPSTFIQVAENDNNAAFTDMLTTITASDAHATLSQHFKDDAGYLTADQLSAYLEAQPEIYLCGGTSFLKSMMQSLHEYGVDVKNVHYETFMPRLSFTV